MKPCEEVSGKGIDIVVGFVDYNKEILCLLFIILMVTNRIVIPIT
jgi:hypothetical protein